MRIPLLCGVAVAVALCGAATGRAATAEPVLEEVEVYVQDLDRNGRPKGPKVKLSPEEAKALRVSGSDRRPDGEKAPGPAALRQPASVRRTASSGCRSVGVARVGRSLFGFVTYKFWQQKDYCWSYPRVTGALSHAWVTNVDPNWRFHGIVSSWGDFYSWCCGTWNSGHQSFRQGAMENCVLNYGCIRSEYPWVMIRGHADGSFSYDTGT
jgi:hypothetical protein